jgi:hypothetical protein
MAIRPSSVVAGLLIEAFDLCGDDAEMPRGLRWLGVGFVVGDAKARVISSSS